jgi:hypothetical protein
MISAFLASAVLATAVHVNFVRPWRRRRKLRSPVDAFFVVPRLGRDCEYAAQDSEDHDLKEIVLPPNAEIIIHLIYKPRLSLHTTETYFGCDPIKAAGQKPLPIEFDNPFILEGRRRRVVPGPHTDDYRDALGYYHVVENKAWSVGVTRALAFKVRTGDVGVYKAMTYFAGEEVMGSAKLMMRVEEGPRTSMRCVRPEHRRLPCARGMPPKPAQPPVR